MFRLERLACATMVVNMVASLASAQETTVKPIRTIQNWSVYVHETEERKQCFAASVPKRSRNIRGGKPASVRRGITQVSVMFQPNISADGEVSFTGGYQFDPKETVTLTVSGNTFTLYVDGDWAWAASPEEDRKIHNAFRLGAAAVITGISSRGTTTTDTFSLYGFTKAFETARNICSKNSGEI
ncbi:MAG: invasion associated locus B family protein [Rhodobacteraceae bacterium]|nr:invasion associated locus B family protein [Paracoccaceae bacterium]